MKKLLLINLAILLSVVGFGQGAFPVPTGKGSIEASEFRQRVADSGGTYYPNVAAHEIDERTSYGLNPVFEYYPAAVETSVAFSQKPTDGTGDFTVTRAGIKTRVNEDGYLEEIAANIAAIDYTSGIPTLNTEPAATNLLTYSNAFGNSYWTKGGATIEGDASTAGSAENVSTCVDGDYTTFSGASATGFTATSNGGGTHEAGTADEIVVTVGEMFKVTFTLTLTSGTAPTVSMLDALNGSNIANAKTFVPVAGSNTTYFLGSTATTGLIQFQNTSTASSFAIASLSVSNVTGYPSPSVDYPTDGYKLVEDGTTGSHRIESNISVSNTTVYTYTMYAKANERNWFSINAVNGGCQSWFDLTNGVVGTVASGTASITALVNGWYRCSVTGTSSSTTVVVRQYVCDSDNNVSYTGDGTSGLYIYGTQLEQSSYPTSPIYTSGATASRIADAVSLTGLQSFLGATTGTIVFEVDAGNATGSDTDLWLFEDTGAGDELGLRFKSDETWQWYDHHSSALIGTASSGSSTKIGITWSGTAAIISKDGSNESVTLSAAFDAITDISLGASFPSAGTKLLLMDNAYWSATDLNNATTP